MDHPPFPTHEMTEEEAAAEKARLEKEVFAAFDRKDFAAAEAGLRELIPLDHENFVPWYNLACALSMQHKTDEALEMLKQSIARGFADLRGLRADPQLANIRTREEYKAIEAAWGSILEKRTERTIENAKKKFKVGEKGSPYICEKDEALHLIYISAFDPALFAEAKKEAAKLDRWWRVLAGEPGSPSPASEPPESERRQDGSQSSRLEGPGSPTPWVLVILPTRKDYIAWAIQRYGDRFDRVGGEYNHDAKTLVAMDLGSSWRHEFWHIMHWRDMDRRNQRHPMWVMEGLCSLVEDCDTGPDGAMVPSPSWRTNMVARMGRAGALIPWEVMFSTGHRGFMGSRTLAYYGESRAMFLFLAERGHLGAWYQYYTAHYKEDPTGQAAFESVLGKPIKECERDFRRWVATLPEVAEEVGRGPANLPVDLAIGNGAGPIVKIDELAEFMAPASRQTNSQGLRDKDVITAIDSKPVRDLNDIARVLGEYEAGATVSVSYIRGRAHGELKVRLVPPR
jgi:hypothetical protein